MLQKQCRRCGYSPIPFYNECLACLDKKRAEYEGTWGYWGEDEGLPVQANRNEKRNSIKSRAGAEQEMRDRLAHPHEKPPKNERKARIERLLEGHKDVAGFAIVGIVDGLLSGGDVRHGGTKSLQEPEFGTFRSADILHMGC